MTAEQMFKELGYKKCVSIPGYTDGSFEYINKKGHYVSFSLYDKTFYSSSFVGDELYKAITQRMKELGWLDDR